MWSYIQYKRIGEEVERSCRERQTTKLSKSSSAQQENGKNVDGGQHEGHLSTWRDRDGTEHQDDSTPIAANSSKEDKIQIECDSDHDPFSPKNWSLLARSKNIAILSLLIFVQAYAGASDSIANTSISQEFHVSKTAENMATAMYLFGIGSGCLIVGPLSETVGRNPVYLGMTFGYLFFVLGSALVKNYGGQIVCRFLVGLFASGPMGINGASVKDQFRPVKRAFVFPVVAWVNVVPPTIAPIVGGWVVTHTSWRWVEWITLIISGFAFLVAFFFLPETHLPVLLDWKAKHMRRVTGDQRYVSEHAEQSSFLGRMKEVLPLSATFLATEPVITVLGAYLTLLYILLYSFLSGFDYIFKNTYSLSNLQTGACFGSIAVGATLFTLTAPGLYSWARHHTEYVRGAKISPEFRLWPAMATAPLLPISLFWLGWTNYASVSIWSGLFACFTFGIVLCAMYVSSYEYIIDSYGEHAAVALASITMVRYLIAGCMVIAARPMYEGIGVHWAMTLLGCVAVIITPGPYLLYRYGEKLRHRSPYAKEDFDDNPDLE